ncbi:MAG TPA: Trk system potassium transporter TrkA [Chlamydiales bacterium]|nr:Trk system potassium transporter TrkA [Chlamydiales bacterium]
MHIVILGAGDLGTYAAKRLAKESHDVVIIDQDEKKIQTITQEIDAATLVGKASDWKLFQELMKEDSLFLALTGSDEVNLSACHIAKNLGYQKTICRLIEPTYLDRLSIDLGKLFSVDHFVCAEAVVANELLSMLLHPSDLFSHTFAHGSILMRTLKVPIDWKKETVPLSKLGLPRELLLGLIKRGNEVIFPHGQDVIMPEDEITMVGASYHFHHLHEIFPVPKKKPSSVTVTGDTKTSLHLCHFLQKKNISFKIIEHEEKTCEKLAAIFPKATVLNHNEKDLDFLLSEKGKGNVFISLRDKDEENLLLSALAKEADYEKVAVLLTDNTLAPILQKMGISYVFSEKVSFFDKVLALISPSNVMEIASLADGKASVIEIKVSPRSELIGIPLANLSSSLPQDLIIAVVENKGKVKLGKGDISLSENDTVVLLASSEKIHEIKDLF